MTSHRMSVSLGASFPPSPSGCSPTGLSPSLLPCSPASPLTPVPSLPQPQLCGFVAHCVPPALALSPAKAALLLCSHGHSLSSGFASTEPSPAPCLWLWQPFCSTQSIQSPRLVFFPFLLEHPFGIASFSSTQHSLSPPGSYPAQLFQGFSPCNLPFSLKHSLRPSIHVLSAACTGLLMFYFPGHILLITQSHSSSSIWGSSKEHADT